jgi:hypothetical protein
MIEDATRFFLFRKVGHVIQLCMYACFHCVVLDSYSGMCYNKTNNIECNTALQILNVVSVSLSSDMQCFSTCA